MTSGTEVTYHRPERSVPGPPCTCVDVRYWPIPSRRRAADMEAIQGKLPSSAMEHHGRIEPYVSRPTPTRWPNSAGQGHPIEQPVYFSWTRPQFGGRRPWFLCPRCISRVALLYLRGESWACRRCHDLRYQSELEPKGRRGLMMVRKIQVRLGGDRSGFEFPDKPRGMHRRTYERWREKHEAAVAKSRSGLGWSRIARRLGLR